MKLWLIQTIVGILVLLVAMLALGQKARDEVRQAQTGNARMMPVHQAFRDSA